MMLPRHPPPAPSNLPRVQAHPAPSFGPSIPIVSADDIAGFDASLPWLMVPLDGTRWVQLLARGSDPLTLDGIVNGVVLGQRQSQCGTAWIRDGRVFVHGTRSDRATLVVRQGKATRRLVVSIKDVRPVSLIVHYVEHGLVRKTRTTPDDLAAIVKAANDILVPQANVRIVVRKTRTLTHEKIGRRLGRTVETTAGDDSEWRVVTGNALSLGLPDEFNLFLVQRYENLTPAGTGDDELADTEVRTGCCIMEDHIADGRVDVRKAGNTLAHEVGHRLGLEHTTESRNRLMYPTGSKATTLTWWEADRINPSKTRPRTINPFAPP
jgi:hypothetical protein